MTIQKPDFNQIFASQAPDVDKPPVFNNYNGGMGDEYRPNNGKPTIKGFNYLQQLNDNKFLWMVQNGAFPYDPNTEYNVGIVTLKDGRFKQWNGTDWINFGQDDSALKIANNLSDVPNKTTARNNLDVYSKSETNAKLASDELLYMPTPYPKSTPPQGYLAMMGQAISQATYPILYGLYGAVLPDLRAYTIRGLDNGRGIDIDRTILSEQEDAIRNITGQFMGGGDGTSRVSTWFTNTNTGAFALNSALGGASKTNGAASGVELTSAIINIDASRVVPTADEVRVKNIAFLYIVKAG